MVLASRATALDGQRLAALLDDSAATVLQATPATWRLLLESGLARRRAGLKMLCGGEALPRDLADRLLGAARRAVEHVRPDRDDDLVDR